MPRFYFDVREGAEFTSDTEYEAARAAAEIGRDDLPNGKAREVTVEVRDEYGQQVFTATVSMTVRRMARALE